MENNVWYKISANKIATKNTLLKLGLKKAPSKKDNNYEKYKKLFIVNLAKARGVKYGVKSYSQMYMREREKILGNWQQFFTSFCSNEEINTDGHILIAGINDGQEIGFLKAKHITGVDISREAIERGRLMYPEINFIINDLVKFTTDKDSVDTYLSLRTLHFFKMPEIRTILSSAYKSLKKHGEIIISVPGGFLTEDGKIVFGQKIENDIVDRQKPMKDALKIESLLKETGFLKAKTINKKIEIFVIGIKGDV